MRGPGMVVAISYRKYWQINLVIHHTSDIHVSYSVLHEFDRGAHS